MKKNSFQNWSSKDYCLMGRNCARTGRSLRRSPAQRCYFKILSERWEKIFSNVAAGLWKSTAISVSLFPVRRLPKALGLKGDGSEKPLQRREDLRGTGLLRCGGWVFQVFSEVREGSVYKRHGKMYPCRFLRITQPQSLQKNGICNKGKEWTH